MSDFARTAFHEAGHGLVALGIGLPIACVTVEPDPKDRTLGSVTLDKPQNDTGKPLADSLTPEQRARIFVWSLAWSISGPIAERLAFGREDGGCSLDFAHADAAVEQVDGAVATQEWQYRPLIEASVESYLSEHWPIVSRLAAALLKERSMTGERAIEIVGAAPPLDLTNAEGGIKYWSERMAARARSHAKATT